MYEALGDRPSAVRRALLQLLRGEAVDDKLRALRTVVELMPDLRELRM
jgi:hypothetical protein